MSVRRIAYVLNIFPKVSETFIISELAELRRRGVELRILSLLPPRDHWQREVVRGAGLDQLVEYDVCRFPEAVRAFQPELLHAHFAREATEKARELSAAMNIPFTFTAHGYDIHRKPPPDFASRAEAARAVVTVSEANRDYIARTFGVPLARVHVIPCGVDTDRFCPDESRSAGDATAPWLMVCVARHVAVKNLGLLLEACARLRGRGVNFRCVMIGDGPLKAELEAKRASLGLGDLVEMPGAAAQEEVLGWWRRARIGVLSSDNEGMPVSLMEAAACGVPVAATRVGGIPELVEHGVTGLLTPPGDAEALSATLEQLLCDDALRQRLSVAARRRAVEKFSVRRQVDLLLGLWEQVLADRAGDPGEEIRRASATPGLPFVRPRIPVSNPFGVAADKEMPTLALALDPETARHEFKRRLPRLSGAGTLKLRAIRLTRFKPGRRAVVEYDVEVRQPAAASRRVTLLGKLRVRRSGNEGFRQLEAFWKAGFDGQSEDAISVPEPIGVISKLQMWFQLKVSGETSEALFAKAGSTERVAMARRIAAAMHKVHQCGVPTDKEHNMADELRILRGCFLQVAARRPEWQERLERLMLGCEHLGGAVPATKPCGIHRDFYPAQVLVDGGRLWVIDFDLYCLGDPGLDAGNFIGHITEQALRERGDPQAFADAERALEERFVELAGETVRASVRAYTLLTLARHIFLSTRFVERSGLTERLLELCEQRLRE